MSSAKPRGRRFLAQSAQRVCPSFHPQALQLMNGDLAGATSPFMAGRIIDSAGEAGVQIESAERTRQLEKDQPAAPVKSRGRWLALATVATRSLTPPID